MRDRSIPVPRENPGNIIATMYLICKQEHVLSNLLHFLTFCRRHILLNVFNKVRPTYLLFSHEVLFKIYRGIRCICGTFCERQKG